MTFGTFVEPFERNYWLDLEALLTELHYSAPLAPLLSVQVQTTFKKHAYWG